MYGLMPHMKYEICKKFIALECLCFPICFVYSENSDSHVFGIA